MPLALQEFAELGKRTQILDGSFSFIEIQVRAHDAAEKNIPHLTINWPSVFGPAKVKKRALQIAFGGRGSRLTGVVGLNGAGRHQSIRAAFDGVTDQILKFACLVAASFESRQIVALYPKFAIRQMFAEILKRVNRCRELRQRRPGPAGQMS